MKHNYKVYNDRLRMFKFFGKGDLKMFERIALFICFIINLIMFYDNE